VRERSRRRDRAADAHVVAGAETAKRLPPQSNCVDALELSTVVYAPPSDVYDFLREFTAYEQYSDYVQRVRRSGDGGVGSAYEITVQWWRLSYTVTPRVTALDPPHRIDWRVVDRVEAEGYWAVEPLPDDEVPDDRDCATRARLRIEFVQSSLSNGVSGLPPLVPFDRILQRVTPVAKREIDAVFRRAVADLEGDEREVEVEYHRRPDVLARR
jgi:ribosome-associated toxin RatA of RatAB toxin-antitoxin module